MITQASLEKLLAAWSVLFACTHEVSDKSEVCASDKSSVYGPMQLSGCCIEVVIMLG